MDGLAEFRLHGKGKNTARFALRLLPFVVIDTLSLDEELLDGVASVRLLRNHGPRTKEDAIKRHRLRAILDSPFSGNIRPHALAITKAGASNERDVSLGPNGSVGCKDRLMEIFVRVMRMIMG